MHHFNLDPWKHSHTFGQELKRPGEARTLIVIGITGAMMVIEIVASVLFGSMALLADGLHMASHAVALSINAFAYVYARRHAHNTEFSFGTGKVNALGGFTGAVLLAVFSLMMAWKSFGRLIHPVNIIFNQAILVAVVGLVVNGVSIFILGTKDHDHEHNDHPHPNKHTHDHNLRSAYLHVLADALTSLLAIAALLSAKFFGALWMDPAMGIAGAILVAQWSFGLLRTTGAVLLDRQGPKHMRQAVRENIERDRDSRVADMHLWSIGPGVFALELTVVAYHPATPEEYKLRMPKDIGLAHISIEVNQCTSNIKSCANKAADGS
ncbi:cation diffusion facilitator family transporter [delta proteobacterium NaphS2]|nr:cation diffusion facilitator family transporter [delta proteobacterium NaphS2]